MSAAKRKGDAERNLRIERMRRRELVVGRNHADLHDSGRLDGVGRVVLVGALEDLAEGRDGSVGREGRLVQVQVSDDVDLAGELLEEGCEGVKRQRRLRTGESRGFAL